VTVVTIVDSGIANLASVSNAFTRLGANVRISDDPEAVAAATHVVLPGVGHFAAGMRTLRARRLDEPLREIVEQGRPLLGICLGMQLMCRGSEESPDTPGLGIIPGHCRTLPPSVHVPHLGWNGIIADPGCRTLGTGTAAFANSFALRDAVPGWHGAWATHGDRFVAALERDNVVACQFHPELSGPFGYGIIERWLCGGIAAPPEAAPPATLALRIIPCLDVKDGRVVKGIRFQSLRDSGDPAARAALYEEQGADEIVILDVGASPEARPIQIETVRRVRTALSIPLTVGGGVRAARDARALLEAGADKVSTNTAAVRRPALLRELTDAFGSQCAVLAIDARRLDDSWEVLVNGGRDAAGRDAVEWAREGVAQGAGEILLTSWDRDGTRSGCDTELLRAVTNVVPVPVIASGGIGSREHVVDAARAGASAVLAASVFHDNEDTVAGIKAHLATQGIPVRL
jgi:imidazole glycerol phosphate synthase glutamine amidotransferase subunit